MFNFSSAVISGSVSIPAASGHFVWHLFLTARPGRVRINYCVSTAITHPHDDGELPNCRAFIVYEGFFRGMGFAGFDSAGEVIRMIYAVTVKVTD